MGRKIKIDYQLVKKYYDDGMHDAQIAYKLKCGKTTIRLWRVSENLPPRNKARNAVLVDYAKVEQLYDNMLTDKEIAQELSCSCNTISSWRKHNGYSSNIPLRKELGTYKLPKERLMMK